MYLDNVEYTLYIGDTQILPTRYKSFVSYLCNFNSSEITATIAWSIKRFIQIYAKDMGVTYAYIDTGNKNIVWSFHVQMTIGTVVSTICLIEAT